MVIAKSKYALTCKITHLHVSGVAQSRTLGGHVRAKALTTCAFATQLLFEKQISNTTIFLMIAVILRLVW